MSRIDRSDRGSPASPVRGGAQGRADRAGGGSATGATSTGAVPHPPDETALSSARALDRIRRTAAEHPGDARAMLRAVMEPSLAAALGRDTTADPAFFGLVDAVVDALLASPDAMRLLDEARAQLGRDTPSARD